jgi:hypothetical protein
MSLSSQIALTAARLLQQSARGYAGVALRLARRGAERAADRIEAEEPRITALTEAGLLATEVSCRCLDRLVRQGLGSAKGALNDSAERLRISARAESFAALYAAQRASLPASRERVAKELGAAWKIVVSTGRELADIARSTRDELGKSSASRGRVRSRARRSTTRRTRRPPQRGVPRST